MTTDNDKPGAAEPGMQRPGGRRNLSRSATRALDILEYFALVGRPLRTVEIAQSLDLQASSTDQLLKTMVDSAYLMFDASTKRYYPSPRLVNFGSWLSSNYFGEDRICRLLKSIQQESGEIVTLSIRYGTSMQIVDYIEPVARAGSIVKGSRVPIAGSIIGTAFLSLHDDKAVIRIVEQVIQESGVKLSVPELRGLLKRVEEARVKGYASGAAIGLAEPWALAIPLPRPVSGMKMVLGMAGEGASVQDRESRLVHIIRAGIQSLSGA
jgi:DNA-binding IclR family transcriptional regulator